LALFRFVRLGVVAALPLVDDAYAALKHARFSSHSRLASIYFGHSQASSSLFFLLDVAFFPSAEPPFTLALTVARGSDCASCGTISNRHSRNMTSLQFGAHDEASSGHVLHARPTRPMKLSRGTYRPHSWFPIAERMLMQVVWQVGWTPACTGSFDVTCNFRYFVQHSNTAAC